MKNSKMVNVLKASEFFKSLEDDQMRRICDLCQMQSYESGESIFQQGDFGEHIYVISEGRVVLERSIDLGSRKGKIIIDILGRGRVLGCWSTLLGEDHILMSTAFCQQPTEVMAFKGSDLRNVMLEDKDLGFLLMERFCFLLRERIAAAYGALEKL